MVCFRAEAFRQDSLVEGHPESKLCQKFLGGGLEGFPDLFVVNLYKSQRSGERGQRTELCGEIFAGLGDALPQERELFRRAAMDCRGDVAELLLEFPDRIFYPY